jgi:hypothetical protein
MLRAQRTRVGAGDIVGPQLSVAVPATPRMVFWDCLHGHQLRPSAEGELSFTIEGDGGLGC